MLAILLAISLGAPASLALPTDAPVLDAPAHGDAPSVSSVWDSSARPAPVITVRPPQDTQPPAPERALSANPLWEIPLSSLSTTRERPIFSPLRRPPPPVVAAAPPPQAPSPPKPPRVEQPQLSLVGTVGGEEESFGIFVDQATKAALRLRVGEDYQGWKLRAVQGREVTLERDQQTTILSLPQPGAGALGAARGRLENLAAQKLADPPPQRDPRR
jgi:general secretion pathway protein N